MILFFLSKHKTNHIIEATNSFLRQFNVIFREGKLLKSQKLKEFDIFDAEVDLPEGDFVGNFLQLNDFVNE